jgi:hypothetical protein
MSAETDDLSGMSGEDVVRHVLKGQLTLQRRLAAAEAKADLQQRLLDSHEHRVAMLETALPKGNFNA